MIRVPLSRRNDRISATTPAQSYPPSQPANDILRAPDSRRRRSRQTPAHRDQDDGRRTRNAGVYFGGLEAKQCRPTSNFIPIHDEIGPGCRSALSRRGRHIESTRAARSPSTRALATTGWRSKYIPAVLAFLGSRSTASHSKNMLMRQLFAGSSLADHSAICRSVSHGDNLFSHRCSIYVACTTRL
jgi:hypothetical protein